MHSKLLIYMSIAILDYKLILISSMVEQNTSNIPILVRIWNEKMGSGAPRRVPTLSLGSKLGGAD